MMANVKVKLSVLDKVPCHEDVWGSRCIAPWVVRVTTRPLYLQRNSCQ